MPPSHSVTSYAASAEGPGLYLQTLDRTWRLAAGGLGRKHLVEALVESVDVLGLREMVLRLTPEAVAHRFHEVIPERALWP